MNNYYHAEPVAVQAMASVEPISVYELRNGVMVFAPEEPLAGFIFYPGGKVEHTAYAPLLHACAERQILCVLIRMPYNLAVLNARPFGFDVRRVRAVLIAEGLNDGFPRDLTRDGGPFG